MVRLMFMVVFLWRCVYEEGRSYAAGEIGITLFGMLCGDERRRGGEVCKPSRLLFDVILSLEPSCLARCFGERR